MDISARKIRFFVLLLCLFTIWGCTLNNETSSKDEGNVLEAPDTDVVPVQEKVSGNINTVQVEGNVSNPGAINLDELKGCEVAVAAEETRCDETLAASDFIGIPLRLIVEAAGPVDSASKLTILAADGYKKSLPLEDILANDKVIMITDNDELRIIAPGYDASYWVSNVITLQIK